MKTLAQSEAAAELHPELEVPTSVNGASEKVEPPSGVPPFCPIISIPPGFSRGQGKGFFSVDFCCPLCGSEFWGTSGLFGLCNGSKTDDYGSGWKAVERCTFKWLRTDDWRVFVDGVSGIGFASRDDFERAVGP